MKRKMKVRLVCDDCGCEIMDAADGELAVGRKDRQRKCVLVVHVPSACERWKHKIHNPPQEIKERGTIRLDCFIGRLGLLDLIAKIEDGFWPAETGWELIRRLHVPGYEQYRLFRREYNAGEPEYELPAKPDRSAYADYLALKKESMQDEARE